MCRRASATARRESYRPVSPPMGTLPAAVADASSARPVTAVTIATAAGPGAVQLCVRARGNSTEPAGQRNVITSTA